MNGPTGDDSLGDPPGDVAHRIADLYDAKGAVLVGADGRPVFGDAVGRVRPGTLSLDEARLLSSATESDVQQGQALYGVRSMYRNRVLEIHPRDIGEPRLRAVRAARGGAFDYILDDDITGIDAGRSRLVGSLAGDVWFVPKVTADLIDHASEAMPTWTLSTDDLPVSDGLVVFAEPAEYENTEAQIDVPYWVSAISWSLIEHRDERYAQFDDWEIHTTPRSDQWQWTPAGRHGWFVGSPVDDFGRVGVRPGNTVAAYRQQSELTRRRMACLWALAATPRLLTTVEEPVDRATRRRNQRDGVASRLVIVDLRRPQPTSTGESGTRTVDWSHRWIVGGHWRQQPYGPGGTQRRPTWIPPHVKGPDGLPLVVKERVSIVRPDSPPPDADDPADP